MRLVATSWHKARLSGHWPDYRQDGEPSGPIAQYAVERARVAKLSAELTVGGSYAAPELQRKCISRGLGLEISPDCRSAELHLPGRPWVRYA